MNFTGISIYLISARFYSVIQDLLHHFKNSELGETIPGAVCKAEPRRACSSGAMREGRGCPSVAGWQLWLALGFAAG